MVNYICTNYLNLESMTEKIGMIKNPLTIIAIFAGIAEVSGTIVLPFISTENQAAFIYFLICFPTILVIVFFITLNFNNKVLYAPSDYKDETNYISINKYDISKQKDIEVIVAKDDIGNKQFIAINNSIQYLTNKISNMESVSKSSATDNNFEDFVTEDISDYRFLVTNFKNANTFLKSMRKIGVDFDIYSSPLPEEYSNENEDYHNYSSYRAIWLGRDISFNVAKKVIKNAKSFYPHLKYIKLSDDSDPDHTTLYIGGSTNSAIKMFKCLPLSNTEFKELENIENSEQFHQYIERFSA